SSTHPPTPQSYTLSLHDALPIFGQAQAIGEIEAVEALRAVLDLSVRQHLVSDVPLGVFLSGGIDSSTVAAYAARHFGGRLKTFSDRKSTRLNSSHVAISYAVFCL